jgi:tRNA A37 methylthiotransferase MiaB
MSGKRSAYVLTIRAIKRECPSIQIRTQLMVGFPTETETDFRQTLRLLEEPIDFVEAYLFQRRPRTKAEAMTGRERRGAALRRYLVLYARSLFR